MAATGHNWRRLATTVWVVVTVAAFAFALAFHGFLGEAVSTQVERPLAFWLRSRVTGPAISPRLKMFVIDDPAVSAMQRFDPTLEEWGKVFVALERAGAAVIMVDKIFDQFYRDEESKAFGEVMRTLKTPVLTVGFVSSKPIPLRTKSTDAGHYAAAKEVLDAVHGEIESVDGVLYGASPKVAAAFQGLGHGMYGGDGLVSPFLKVGGDVVVPHFVLAAIAATAERERLPAIVKGMPRLQDGKILLNFNQEAAYGRHAYSFWPLLTRARDGRPVEVVKPGDFVLVIPGGFSGGTDFYATPVGMLPGGFVVATFLNSVLEGRWLHVLRMDVWLALLFGLAGAWFGSRLRPMAVLAIVAAVVAAWTGVFALVFTYLSTLIPLVTPGATLIFAGVVASAESARRRQLESARMAAELATAKAIQETLTPKAQIRLNGLDLFSDFRPATECAGDFFAVASSNPRRHYVAVGDAVGHGVGPAMISAIVYGGLMNLVDLMRAGSLPPLSAYQVMEKLNDMLIAMGREESLMAVSIAVIDLQNDAVEIANGGQPFPLLVGPAGVATLTIPGNPLGIEWERKFSARVYPFAPGTRLVLFSDGTFENLGTNGQALTRMGFIRMVRRLQAQQGETFFRSLVQGLDGHLGTSPLADDITLVVLQRV